MRQVVITPAEEGGFYASVPSLPGCHSEGETWEETLSNIKEAIDLFIEDMIENGEVKDDGLTVDEFLAL